MTAPETNLADIRQAWEARGNSSATSGLQQQALDNFLAAGFPTTRLEDWKYTDTRSVAKHYPQWLSTTAETQAESPECIIAADAFRLVFIDGRFAPEQSSADLPTEVYGGDLAGLAEKYPEACARTFGKLATAPGYTSLNTAFAQDVAAIVLPDNTELDKLVYLNFYTATPEVIAQPRLLIDIGKHSRATVIEHYTSSAAAIVNTVSEARCDTGSDLTWYRLQAESNETSHLSAQYLSAEQDAT
ncbi:MAG: SufD family Fe-S cluster assembly protein, partial [Gammaproteobacteria bacterium]